MLGIVILNFKSWQETTRCVESIYQTAKVEFKIVIVDNHSPNDAYERLQEMYRDRKEIICIQNEYNGGFSKGNNIGVKICEEEQIDYVIVSNSDIVFLEGCIDKLYMTAKENANAVQIAPKILDKNLRFMSPPWSGRQSLLQYLHIKSPNEFIMREEELTGVQKVYMVPGGCFLVNMKLFAKIGYFDENTFLYNEEGMLSVKAKEAGYDVLFNGNCTVIHNHGASTEKGTLFADAEILKSGMYYWKKYEKVSNIKIVFIYSFMVLRMLAKVICRRVKSHGFEKYMKECFKELLKVLKG